MTTNNKLKYVSGIDTLYYFVSTDIEKYSVIYDEIDTNIKNDLFQYDCLQFLGTSKGFHWFNYFEDDIHICKIGFKSYLKQRNVKDIYVQLVGQSIYYNGLSETISLVDDVLQKIGIDIIEKHISRADLNIFCNISFESLDTVWLSTRSKSESSIFAIKDGKKIETIYFGKRSNGKVLRIYNKINEIKKDITNEKNKILVNYLKNKGIFDTLDNTTLWNIELELHRKHLKKFYDVDTLKDFFDKVYSIWYDEINRFRILKKDISKRKYLKNDKNKIDELSIWSEIKNSYTQNTIFIKGIKNKMIPYKMTKKALFMQTLDLLQKYNNFQNDDKDKLNANNFVSEFIEFVCTLDNDSYNLDNDFYKFIDVEKFDSFGLLRKKDKLLRPFYLDNDFV